MSSITIPSKRKKYSDFEVEFSSSEGSFPSIVAEVVGKSGPYEYKWSIPQGITAGHVIVSADNSSSVNLDTVGINSCLKNTASSSLDTLKASLVRLDVTDANNVKKTFYYNYKVEAYPIYELNTEPVTASYMGDPDTQLVSIPMVGVDFLDNIKFFPTYEELNNYCCPGSQLTSSEMASEWDTNYRASVDQFYYDQYEYILNSVPSGRYNFPPPSEYLPFEPDYQSFVDSGSVSIYNKGPFRNANIIFGSPHYKYEELWNSPIEGLDGDSIGSRIGATTLIEFLYDIPTVSELPETGSVGQKIYVVENDTHYLWDPTVNAWNDILGNAFDSLYVDRRARRDSFVGGLKTMIRALRPFTSAAIHLPLHRIRKELV